jgi:hypothetical protein
MKPKPDHERRTTAERRANPRSGRRSGDSHEERNLRVKRIVDYLSRRKLKKPA